MKYLVFSILALILFVLPIYYIPYTIYSAIAAESTPSSNLSGDLKAKLDEFLKQSASKAAQLKQEVNRKLLDKAYAGTLKSKDENSLQIIASDSAKTVTINQDTVFDSNAKKKQKFSLKTLSEGDYIAALGDVDDNGVLTARKVVLLSPFESTKTFLWGQIVSISDKLITIQSRQLKNTAVSFSQANIKKGDKLISLNDLNIRDFVIVTGNTGKNNIFQAQFIYVIPQGGFIKPKKIVYPERSRGATPSAKVGR